jgi:uncharacterized protein YdeI (YjbR/CyaY-like superfamily)
MSNMIRDPSEYFSRGCGRCPLFDTPRCKAKRWALPLAALRKIIRSTGLDEEAKWGVPVYTDRGKNILILSALKDLVSVGFLKGVLMSDPAQVLEKPGPNSHIDRVLRFRDMKRIDELEETLRDHIREAVEIERSGQEITSPAAERPGGTRGISIGSRWRSGDQRGVLRPDTRPAERLSAVLRRGKAVGDPQFPG